MGDDERKQKPNYANIKKKIADQNLCNFFFGKIITIVPCSSVHELLSNHKAQVPSSRIGKKSGAVLVL